MARFDSRDLFAEITGFEEGEIAWTYGRLKQLKAQGKPRDKIKAIMAEEAKLKPWV